MDLILSGESLTMSSVDIAERIHDFKYGTASHYIDIKIKYEKD